MVIWRCGRQHCFAVVTALVVVQVGVAVVVVVQVGVAAVVVVQVGVAAVVAASWRRL